MPPSLSTLPLTAVRRNHMPAKRNPSIRGAGRLLSTFDRVGADFEVSPATEAQSHHRRLSELGGVTIRNAGPKQRAAGHPNRRRPPRAGLGHPSLILP